tara:strand:- start:99 stop:803 length:705 start_codon:yes stop_codon:yes gene_type:complete
VAFHTTRWSLIARANKGDAGARLALDELCRVYWPPVYAMYRGDGVSAEQARDLTQGLFANLLEREDFGKADPERGRFRSFLRTCARNWLLNERDREQALKRGGEARVFSLDTEQEEQRWSRDPADHLDAAAIFERRWAQIVIEQSLSRLAEEEHEAGRGAVFVILRPALEGDSLQHSWAELAVQLGTTEGALRVAVHRLRKRFRERIEAEVRDTLGDTDGNRDELAELLAALQA